MHLIGVHVLQIVSGQTVLAIQSPYNRTRSKRVGHTYLCQVRYIIQLPYFFRLFSFAVAAELLPEHQVYGGMREEALGAAAGD